MCVACDLDTTAPWSLRSMVGDSSRRSEEIVKNLKLHFSVQLLLLLLILEGEYCLCHFIKDT